MRSARAGSNPTARRRDDLTLEARNSTVPSATLGCASCSPLSRGRPAGGDDRILPLARGPMCEPLSCDCADVTLAVHVEGPAEGDVVVVTEPPVIKALADGTLTVQKALELGVIRFYGKPAISQAAVEWFRR